ncbi:MAG: MFS transporter [Rhodospirillaceae bacterium]|nr:MFS transporter [Rhodospirillaceae bacterium]
MNRAPAAVGAGQAMVLGLLLSGCVLYTIGNGLHSTVLGVRGDIEGWGSTLLGIIMAGFSIGYMAGTVLAPRAIRQSGHVRAFAAAASMLSIVTIAHAIVVDPAVWFALRLVHGVCYAVLGLVAESWLNAAAAPGTRGRVFGLYAMLVLLSFMASQVLLVVADPSDFVLFALVSILISASLVPLTLSGVDAPRDIPVSRMSFRRVFEVSPVGAVGCFTSGVVFGASFSLCAVYARQVGMDQHGISLFMAGLYTGGMLMVWPIGWLSDRMDRRIVIAAAAILAGVLALVVALAGGSMGSWGLIIANMLFGTLMTPNYALCVAHSNDFVDRAELVGLAAALLMIYAVGQVLGPLAAGLLMDWTGPSGLYLLAAAVMAAFGTFTLWRLAVGRKPDPAQVEPFVDTPRTTFMASTLDPRGAPEGEDDGAEPEPSS